MAELFNGSTHGFLFLWIVPFFSTNYAILGCAVLWFLICYPIFRDCFYFLPQPMHFLTRHMFIQVCSLTKRFTTYVAYKWLCCSLVSRMDSYFGFIPVFSTNYAILGCAVSWFLVWYPIFKDCFDLLPQTMHFSTRQMVIQVCPLTKRFTT